MREIKNINWNVEAKFPCIQNDYKNEDSFKDDCWAVSFDWNGHHLTAQCDINLSLQTTDLDCGDYRVDVTDFYLHLVELYEIDNNVSEIGLKESKEIQSKLLTELKIML